MIDHFPLDVASEGAFFDRLQERKRLTHNLRCNTHTLVTSPRRYGKTSLVLRSIEESEVIGVPIDMMVATDADKIKILVLDGIGKAVARIATGTTKIKEVIRKIFQPFAMVESVELGKLSLKFHAPTYQEPHLVLLEALQRLEDVAVHTGQKVALFLDEYQHVLDLKGIDAIEASLRSFAQTAKQVVFVFSGSHRHLLQEMFSDKSRPFYNMCDHLFLDRISSHDYRLHLQHLAKQQWKKVLSDESLQLVLNLTACHPYYVNLLCRRLWCYEQCIDVDIILAEWKSLAAEKKYEVSSDFEKITPIQRSILIELAREHFSPVMGKKIITKLNASATGIAYALKGLLQRDYVYQDADQQYHVLDPLMDYVLRERVRYL